VVRFNYGQHTHKGHKHNEQAIPTPSHQNPPNNEQASHHEEIRI
jgi:hypothetical protein